MSRTREMIEAFDNAILNTFPDLNVNGLIIRSDNGSQLTSQVYEKHLRTLGTSNHTLADSKKTIYTRDFINYDEFQRYIDWAINDYNTVRPHSSLNYMTPEEFESAIMNEEFRKKWTEKEIGRKKHVEFLE
jgi:putative transposase